MSRKRKKQRELIIEDITDTAPDAVVEDATEEPLVEETSDVNDEAAEQVADNDQEASGIIEIEEAKTTEEVVMEASDESVEETPKKKRKSVKKAVSKSTVSEENDDNVVITMKNIVKRYFIGQPNELEVLHGIDIKIRRGEFVAIVGQSGSGKSTLMNVIGALDRPTEGEYFLDGVDMFKAKDKDLSAIRCKKIGFVFQTYNLVARTSALKNVELPMLYSQTPRGKRTRRAKELLELVEMTERMKHQPDELSGGQKQRVAIARAMANDPAIILADEPTGALDSGTGRLIMDIFHKLHEEQGKTIILITHSNELAEECERILTLKDGLIIGERKGSGRDAVL